MPATDSATVHWNPPSTPIWRNDATINGLRYPTRNPVPMWADTSDDLLRGLTDDQRDDMRAIHEAAHAVAALAAAGYVHRAWIRTTTELRTVGGHNVISGCADVCRVSNGRDFVTFMAAGERAEDRWLRETGLWTPDIAAGVEYGARNDRRGVLDLNPELGFEGGHNDFLIVHELADQLVDEHWGAVLAVGTALAEQLRLTGDEISELAGLPNGTHSATCTFPPAA